MNKFLKLSNDELELSLGNHVARERHSLDQIYEHINEIYRREIHLTQSYGSMKNYLVKKWNYSERDAYRKIDGARLLKDVPELSQQIQTGKINADCIGELSRAVKEKERATGEKVSPTQKTELVALISGKSVNESQQVLAQVLDIKVKEFDSKRVQKDNSVRLEGSICPEVYEQFKRCQEHAAHKIQQNNMPHSLESMLKIFTDLYMEEHGLNETANTAITKTNKTITPKTRSLILLRDKCCQHKDLITGRLCGSKHFLQVDHKTAIWAGGDNSPSNLQALCANHNQHKYRQEAQISLC